MMVVETENGGWGNTQYKTEPGNNDKKNGTKEAIKDLIKWGTHQKTTKKM